MLNQIQKKIYRLTTHIETFFAVVIDIVIAMSLVVGVEFVKMLVKHTPDNVVEVLIFAISRHLIVYHLTMWEMLIGIVCIAVLFTIRRFLFIPFHHEGDDGAVVEEELSE